ncbi:MAG: hypothetical protein L6R40_002089 [Gallowayella cf. fulva]|nr:MAG: hypothetical protein L6R40_002089 [Xanthomendoza cf. fulva]
MCDHGGNLSENNQTYFDDFASSTNRPSWVIDLGNQIVAELLARLDWIGIPTSHEDASTDCNDKTYTFRLLDYACGEGTLSRGIFNYVDEAWGIDLSAGMVKSYNQQAQTFDIAERKKMFAVQGDLLAPSSADNQHGTSFKEKEWFDFDIAIMSMALHHVASPEDAVKALVERVKEGRSVVFIDLVLGTLVRHGERKGDPGHEAHGHGAHGHGAHGHEAHGHGAHDLPGAHTRTREGFTKEEMEKMLVDAGCEDVGYVEFGEPTRMDFGDQVIMSRMFLVKGRKGKKCI